MTENTRELEPGVYHDIPANDYHALPYLSSSFLKKFKDNPASALLPVDVTDDMNIGSAIHAYSLEGPEAFDREFVVMFESDLNKNTTEYKKQKAAFEEANSNKIILPAKYKSTPTMDVVYGVDNALRAHPLSAMFLKRGFQEVTLIWDDKETGLRCKARLDWNPGNRVLADLKKTADVSKFKSQICNLNYDVQAGHYTNGAKALGMDLDTFIFITVEAEPPYAVKCGYLNLDWLHYGQCEAERLIALVRDCWSANTFPSYTIPGHIYALEQLTPTDLLEEWIMPAWR